MSQFNIDGKVAIVTGSSRGIGKAIAEELAVHGAKVVISSRNQEDCDAVAAAIDAKHGVGTAIAVAANIAHKEALQALVEAARDAFGRIDILVCNAAYSPYQGPLADMPDDKFRKLLEINILSNHWLIAMVAPEMIERRDGSIIIISSTGGIKGSPVIGAYCVSKAGDMQLAKSLAREFGPHNVRINCVAPGLVRTEFARALWEDKRTYDIVTGGTVLGRMGEPEEISGAVAFLASPAGRYVTGQTLIVDGGLTL